MNHRNTIRLRYDIAEYRLISAIALLRAAQEAIVMGDPMAVFELDAARKAKDSAERTLVDAKNAAEQAGIITNAHPALSIL